MSRQFSDTVAYLSHRCIGMVPAPKRVPRERAYQKKRCKFREEDIL